MVANVIWKIIRKGRKLIILIVCICIITIGIWSLTVLERNHSLILEEGPLVNAYGKPVKSYRHAYLLQKLISQANRVLRYQTNKNLDNRPTLNGVLVVPAAAHGSNVLKNSNSIRFINQSKGPFAVKETSAQTSSLLARQKSKIKSEDNLIFEGERLRTLEIQQKNKLANMDEFNAIMDTDRKFLPPAERLAQYQRELMHMGIPIVGKIGPDSTYVPRERLVHIDLKGAPPRISYLKDLLTNLKLLGATGIILEYEDMFPYREILEPISARNAYSRDELQELFEFAGSYNLSVTPLIQTFGHMEYVLKGPEFSTSREVPENPQSVCPVRQKPVKLIETMLTQIIEFHMLFSQVDSKFYSTEGAIRFEQIHIGCNEVYHLAECNDCRQQLPNEAFLAHVLSMAYFIKGRWPSLNIIIWDDMLRNMSLSELLHSQIGRYVEPMIWVYTNDIYQHIQPSLWDIYSRVFSTCWAASSFKGTFGETVTIPLIHRHLENNLRWLAVMEKEGRRFSGGFKGLCLTGWSRNDHFAILCELLPAAIPSLLLCLSTISKGYFETKARDNSLWKALSCIYNANSFRSSQAWIELRPNSHYARIFDTCTYLGSTFYKYSIRLYSKLEEIRDFINSSRQNSAWLAEYNIRHNFTGSMKTAAIIPQAKALLFDLTLKSQEAFSLLISVFDEFTCSEFIEQQIFPTYNSLQAHITNQAMLMDSRYWPQRPLPIPRELLQSNLIPPQYFHNQTNFL